MNEVKSGERADRLVVHYIAPFLLIAGLAFILFATLKDFDFRFQRVSVQTILAGFVLPSSSVLDFVRNILLFIPFGFGLGAILDGFGWPKKLVGFAVFLCGFLLTFSVESLQNFLPVRQPSVADVATNTAGAVLGWLCFRLWQNRWGVIRHIRDILSTPQKVLSVVGIYLLGLILIGNASANQVRFEDWDPTYWLAIGGSPGGNRFWTGSIQDLVFFNRVLETQEARRVIANPEEAVAMDNGPLAYYRLTGVGDKLDWTGNQPELAWLSKKGQVDSSQPGLLDGQHWLRTETSVGDLSRELSSASKLSLRLSAGTGDYFQIGPARLVTISRNPLYRNLTLGQDNDGLIVRFRSPLTGENGSRPQVRFADFFKESEMQDFVITINGQSVDLISSGQPEKRSVELVPGIVFARYLFPFFPEYWTVNASESTTWIFRLIFYIPFFLPLGVLLMVPAIGRWQRGYKAALIVTCLLIFPFLVEFSMAVGPRLPMRPINIALSIVIVLAGSMLMKVVRAAAGRRSILK